MMQGWWMHFSLCPWVWRQGVAPPKVLHISTTWRGNPSFVMVALAVAITIAIAVAISVAVTDSVSVAAAVAVTITHCRYHCGQPLPLRSPSTIAATITVALPSAIAVANALAVGHCRLRHCRPLQLPSPLVITIVMPLAISKSCCLGAARIVFDQLKQRMLTLYYCVWTVGGKIDQSQMTDQVSSGDGQHQCWTVSGKQWEASERSGWQQGGSRGAKGWRHWLNMGGVILFGCWGISHWQMAFVMMWWVW